jgi:hypothetical protein
MDHGLPERYFRSSAPRHGSCIAGELLSRVYVDYPDINHGVKRWKLLSRIEELEVCLSCHFT